MNNAGPTHQRKQYEANKLISRHLTAPVIENVEVRSVVRLFRPRSFGPLAVNRFVQEFAKEADLEQFVGCVVVVDPSRVRVRRPPIDINTNE